MRGRQEPRISLIPPYVSSAGREAIELAEVAGLYLDPWQQFALLNSLGERDDGRWAAFEVGLVVARQNGKDSILEAREIAGLFLFGEDLIIHALALDTPLPTPKGWVSMGEVSRGDWLFAPDGTPTQVVDLSPVFPSGECFRVGFSDGTSVVASGDHLWATESRVAPQRGLAVRNTREIAQSLTWLNNQRTQNNHRIRVTAPLDLPPVNLPIDPYALGYWLGDGFSHNNEICAHLDDIEFLSSELACRWRWYEGRPRATLHGLREPLRDHNLLKNKHVPPVYLRGSIDQRLSLLQGLMDSDGSVTEGGRCQFTQVNRTVADAVVELARSLGWRPQRYEMAERSGGYPNGRCGSRVVFTNSGNGLNPFRLPRKAARFAEAVESWRETPTAAYRSIVSCDPVASVPTKCVAVDNAAHMFLCGEAMVPTHNSAHKFDTAMEHLERLANLIEAAELSKRIRKINRSHGSEGITLKDGRRIRFRARTTSGGGRGYTGDCVIFNEAMDLPDSIVGAMMPTMAARSTLRPGPQIYYAGSAVDQQTMANGMVLARMREAGISGGNDRVAYFEWSAPEDADPEDWEARAAANPGMGFRITPEYVDMEFRSPAMSPRQFEVERLGIGDWPETGEDVGRVIAREVWLAAAESDPTNRIVSTPTFAIDANPDRTRAAIGVAGKRADDLFQFAVVTHRRGLDWLVEAACELQREHDLATFVVDGRGPAGSLIEALEIAGVRVLKANTEDYGNACGQFFDAVANAEARYPDPQPELEAALAEARAAPLGDRWKWARRSVTGADISPLVAVTLALWGARTQGTPTVWNLNDTDAAAAIRAQHEPAEATPGQRFVTLDQVPGHRGLFG